jgi:hypothetical protein
MKTPGGASGSTDPTLGIIQQLLNLQIFYCEDTLILALPNSSSPTCNFLIRYYLKKICVEQKRSNVPRAPATFVTGED